MARPPHRPPHTILGAVVVSAIVAVVSVATPAGAGDPATATVAPDTGLADGQVVAVSGAGWVPASFAFAALCPPGADTWIDDCDASAVAMASTDATGGFATTLAVRATMQPAIGPAVDCTAAPGACVIGVGSNPDLGPELEVPIAFAPPPTTSSTTAAPSTSPTSAPTTTATVAAPAVEATPRFTG